MNTVPTVITKSVPDATPISTTNTTTSATLTFTQVQLDYQTNQEKLAREVINLIYIIK